MGTERSEIERAWRRLLQVCTQEARRVLLLKKRNISLGASAGTLSSSKFEVDSYLESKTLYHADQAAGRKRRSNFTAT